MERAGGFGDMTVPQAITSLLDRAEKPLSAKEITDQTGKNYNTVRGALRTLFYEGTVLALTDQTYTLPGRFPELVARLGTQPRGEGDEAAAAIPPSFLARITELEQENEQLRAKLSRRTRSSPDDRDDPLEDDGVSRIVERAKGPRSAQSIPEPHGVVAEAQLLGVLLELLDEEGFAVDLVFRGNSLRAVKRLLTRMSEAPAQGNTAQKPE